MQPGPPPRSEPSLAASPGVPFEAGPARLDPRRAAAEPEPPPAPRRRLSLPAGVAASLAIHLSPLLLLLSWHGKPAEIAPPIPVQLVIEQPPPEPKAAKPAPPVPTRLASVAMGEAAKAPPRPDEPPPEDPAEASESKTAAALPPPPDLISALPKPVPAPESLPTPSVPEPVALPRPPEPKPRPKPAAAHAPPQPARHPTEIPGPAATRDEYLAYVSTLINRHSDMLPPALLAGRRGVAVISILVLGDGTIARIAIKRGSGYSDVDARIEQMVAAARRFPPLPQWVQGPSVVLDYHRIFPDRGW